MEKLSPGTRSWQKKVTLGKTTWIIKRPAGGRDESGKYAMMLGWDVAVYGFEAGYREIRTNAGFCRHPGNGSFEGPNLTLMTVNRNSPRLDAALDLITFMADPYNYNEAFEGSIRRRCLETSGKKYFYPTVCRIRAAYR